MFDSWVGEFPWRRNRLPSPVFLGFPCGSAGKEFHLQCGRSGFDPWVGKIPRRRAWQPTPVFLPGESPWTEEPGRLQSMGSQRDGHNWVTFTFNSLHLHFPKCVTSLISLSFTAVTQTCYCLIMMFSSVQFSCSVVSDSL